VPFHVEIRRSYRHARVFNVAEEELGRTVLDPWRHGRLVELGDQEWEPRECTLTVLEGPELAPPDLAMGQGWHNAQRSARDVTGRMLDQAASAGEAGAVAVLADTPAAARVAATLLERLGLRPVEWTQARPRLRADADAAGVGFGAALLVLERPDPAGAWLFEAGLAIGALGHRAIVVVLGAAPAPAQLEGLGAIALDLDRADSLQELAERLRAAGCRIAPAPG
jgi:hypothetical protein